MTKRSHDFERVQRFKDRFRALSLSALRNKQKVGFLVKEAAVAVRKLILEKEEVSAAVAAFDWNELIVSQRRVCGGASAEYLSASPELKVGIALSTLHRPPLNGLRHLPIGDTTGWYLWGGEDFSSDPQFFQPLHVAHLVEKSPDALPYLGLAPGWRFLLSPSAEVDIWFDSSLLVE